ncbi:uncharacterized protein EV154DRAFT_484954 [Mucor mucedo]|uniref:uncharacterized protein n=1 Tax=Mucor mucedo TaxID=29922 RepID=UPI00221F171D|nr:uncharacterized protein EV154DRAFT_484954 [Mucor mucedo]KAI7887572.1 hypothetical protein EV154DRAFT_484954 [Mucor mucedo]
MGMALTQVIRISYPTIANIRSYCDYELGYCCKRDQQSTLVEHYLVHTFGKVPYEVNTRPGCDKDQYRCTMYTVYAFSVGFLKSKLRSSQAFTAAMIGNSDDRGSVRDFASTTELAMLMGIPEECYLFEGVVIALDVMIVLNWIKILELALTKRKWLRMFLKIIQN